MVGLALRRAADKENESYLDIQARMLAVAPGGAVARWQGQWQGQGQEQGLYCRRVPSDSTQPTLPLAHPTPDAEFLPVADRGEAWQWLASEEDWPEDSDIVYF